MTPDNCWTRTTTIDGLIQAAKEIVPPTDAQICKLALHTLMDHGLEDSGVEAAEKLITQLEATHATDNS